MKRGGGPENGTTFGVLGTINPKFDPTKDTFGNSFEAWYELVPPVRSHADCQKFTRSRP